MANWQFSGRSLSLTFGWLPFPVENSSFQWASAFAMYPAATYQNLSDFTTRTFKNFRNFLGAEPKAGSIGVHGIDGTH
jgi:hypothetical protein